MRRHYQTIKDIKLHNEESGYYYFSEGAMKFFNSRVAETLFGKHRNIFITSEKFDDDTARFYSVHLINEEGQVECLSEFQEFSNIKSAKRFAEKIAELEKANA